MVTESLRSGPTRLARTRAVAIALAFAVLIPTAPAEAQSAEDIVRGWLDAMRSKGARVEPGSITYQRRNDIVEIRDLKIVPAPNGQTAGGSIRVPSLGFIGLTRSPQGGITAKSMRVSSIEGSSDDGSGTVSVAGVEANDVSLPNFADLGFDTNRPFTSQIRILKAVSEIRATNLNVGRVTGTIRAPEGPITLSYEGLTVSDMSGGRIARILSGPVLISGTASTGGTTHPMEIRIGKGEILGYDLGAYVRVMDDTAYVGGRGDGAWREVQKSASVENISINAGPARITLARAAMGAFRMRQLDQPIGDLLDRATLDPKSFERDEQAALRLGLGVLGSMSIDHYTLDGWNLVGPDLERFLLGRFTVRDVSADGIGEVSLDGFDAVAQGNAIRFARFAFGGLKFPDIRNIERAVAASASGVEIDPTSLAPTLGFLRLDGALIEVPGKGTLGLGSFSVDLTGYIKAIPTNVNVKLRHASVPTSLADDAQSREVFATLGYDRLDLSAEISARWDEATRDLKIETVSAGLADGGTIALEAAFGNIPRALFEAPQNAQQHVAAATLKTFGLGYRDASLFDRLLRLAATQSRLQPEAMRQQAVAAVPALLKDIRDAGLRQKAIDAITAFIRTPKSLSVVSRIARPLPVAQIIGSAVTAPQQLPSILQLDVAANQ